MYTFSASVTSEYVIDISSNTYWSCKAEGNFKLSKYCGTGNDIVNIIIPEDVRIADGIVMFSYGDERCNYPEVTVYLSNNCYIKTNPSYLLCGDEEDKERDILFFYNEPRETFYVSVQCFDGWTVDTADFDYITSNNDVMIIASGRDGELRIVPTHNCNGKNVIHVKLLKKQAYVPPTPPTPPTPPSVIKVTNVYINKTDITLKENESYTLIATVIPTNATNKGVVWKSSDSNVATVTQDGLVTAKQVGDCVITVTTADGGYIATCNVTVTGGSQPTPTPITSKNYLTFVAIESGTFKFESYAENSLSYSTDEGTTWKYLESAKNTPIVQAGSKIMWKGNLIPTTSGNKRGIGNFSSSNKFDVGGNIMSLQYGDDFDGQTNLNGNYTFQSLFSGCTNLVNAENLSLPAENLTIRCYRYMFFECTSLKTAPNLPATEMKDSCYRGMFYLCTSLTLPPKLPATNLDIECYRSMFDQCTSLISAPELPAKKLKNGCYKMMFYMCLKLSNAPKLPATSLTESCYEYMFFGCNSLIETPELPAATLVNRCYYRMFQSCWSINKVKCMAINIEFGSNECTYYWLASAGSTGTFIKSSNSTIEWERGVSGIPNGWTIVNI